MTLTKFLLSKDEGFFKTEEEVRFFLQDCLDQNYHEGDCTGIHHTCQLCFLENLLEEYKNTSLL